jgi:hypothetical protein
MPIFQSSMKIVQLLNSYFTSEDFSSLGMAGPELQEDLATDLDAAERQVSSRPVFKDGHRKTTSLCMYQLTPEDSR